MLIWAATHDELARALREAGVATARSDLAARIVRAVHLRGATSLDEVANEAGLGAATRARLEGLLEFPPFVREAVHAASDGSARYAFRLADGAVIESVLIPRAGGRAEAGRCTICVSSQAGCPLACRFCATGRLGLTRDLAAWEIVAQVLAVARHAGVRPSDIVFMGMGEPLLNEDAVYRAASVMTQPHGLQIGARRITISTAGVVPAIDRFIAARRPWRLVFSLGCADPVKRGRLMPVQARQGGPPSGSADDPRRGFDAFLDAVRRYERFRRGKHVTLEYVAIRNLTMGEDDVEAIARELAGARPPFRFLLNVIPFNPIGGRGDAAVDEFEPPSMAEVRAFTAKLRPLGFPVKIRYSGGQDELAGCGQLGRTLLTRLTPRARPARAAAPS